MHRVVVQISLELPCADYYKNRRRYSATCCTMCSLLVEYLMSGHTVVKWSPCKEVVGSILGLATWGFYVLCVSVGFAGSLKPDLYCFVATTA